MISQPIIHDRHIVKQALEQIKLLNKYENAFEMPRDLTILTCRNEGTMEDRIIPSLAGYEDTSILESSLEYLGIHGLVVLRDKRLPWRNTYKIENIYNYLISGKCTTKYFMYCDAIDVIFKDDPQVVIDIFESFKCKMLFMSTQSPDGYNCMPEIKSWADKISLNRYMNSGVYIGYTDFITSFFKEAMKYITPHGCLMAEYRDYLSTTPSNYPIGSQDQDIFRYIQPKFYPELQVDYKNLMAYRS
jgi:hypothetical protein